MKSVLEYNAFLYNGGIFCGFSDTTKREMNLSSCFSSINILVKSELEFWKKEIELIVTPKQARQKGLRSVAGVADP